MYRSIMWPSWLKRPCGCVNVRAYGAKGDGKTDDAAAIQTAIDALASGGMVFLPSGVYRVESTVKLKSNVRLIGVGIDATVIQAGVQGMNMISQPPSATDTSVENLTIKGTGATIEEAKDEKTGKTVEKPIVERGVWVNKTSKHRIVNCRITNITYGVHFNESHWCEILDCRFDNIVGKPGESHGYAILIGGGGDHLVRGNRFQNVQRHAIYLSAGCSRSVVTENRIFDVKCGAIQIAAWAEQPTCEGNIVALNVTNTDQLMAVGVFENSKDNLVLGNVLSDCEGSGIKLECGAGNNAPNTRLAHNVILGNRILRVGSPAVWLLNADETFILGNDIAGTSDDDGEPATLHGILVTPGGDQLPPGGGAYSRRNRIVGNVVTNARQGIRIDNVSENCQDNRVLSNAFCNCTADIFDIGTNTRVHHLARTKETLSLSTIPAHSTAEYTVTVPGAKPGDIAVAAPESAPEEGLGWQAYVAKENKVTVRLSNETVADIIPDERVWRISVLGR